MMPLERESLIQKERAENKIILLQDEGGSDTMCRARPWRDWLCGPHIPPFSSSLKNLSLQDAWYASFSLLEQSPREQCESLNKASNTSKPIWLPHWPSCTVTIDMLRNKPKQTPSKKWATCNRKNMVLENHYITNKEQTKYVQFSSVLIKIYNL